ncbi:MAG TPA: NAD(P)-dependent oxidoreductase [Gemmataceae bacterium]|jgi:glutamate synthase (NADPH/NADH) small chain|nr:NAD(P)-dependent oxidoreductase [Gemmataceae bacterium]
MPKAGERMSLEVLTRRFADVPPALALDETWAEAARCLYCFDAPCMRACPTHIDVPLFIRQILHKDDLGAARTILGANIFGGSCARACPTEVLCEGACVANTHLKSPIQIGRLQRHATDTASAADVRFFTPGPPTGKRVALIGSGPAGLSSAHELRKLGHEAVVFEARTVAGGLNTLGIAAYKISTAFALTEVDQVLQMGVELRLGQRVEPADLVAMLKEFDAVFLGIGLGQTLPLGIEGESLPGVWEGLEFILQTHTKPFTDCEIGKRVLVIGAGNTAIDVATAAHRLGAEEVTITYRRGPEAMPAFAYEYGMAKADGIRFEWFAQPKRILADAQGRACGVEFVRTALSDPTARASPLRELASERFQFAADMVVKALGQEPLVAFTKALPGLKVDGGKVAINPATGATSVPKLFAGGDCIRNGGEIVDAVQDGKIAALGIDLLLKKRSK